MLPNLLCIQVSMRNRETLCSHQKRSPHRDMDQSEVLRLCAWDTVCSTELSAEFSMYTGNTKLLLMPSVVYLLTSRGSRWVVCRRSRSIYNSDDSQFTCQSYETTRNPRGTEGGWRMQPSESLMLARVACPLMSRIERKCCSISTSYLVRISDIFILLHIWENCVFWCLFTNEDTLWCLS